MHALVDDIYQCALGESDWDSLLPKVRTALGGCAASYCGADVANNRSIQRKYIGFDGDWLADYEQHWDSINPWRIKTFELALTKQYNASRHAIHSAELVDIREFRRTDAYRASLKKMDLADLIIMPMRVDAPRMLGQMVYCGHEKDTFTDEDRQLANHLTPHLQRSAYLTEKINNVHTVFENKDVVSGLIPAIILSDSMELVEQNDLAEEVIFEGGVMIRKGGKAAFADDGAQKKLAEFIDGEMRLGVAGRAEGMLCTLDLTPSLSANVVRLSSVWSLVMEPSSVSEYMITFDIKKMTPVSVISELSEEYGFTNVEKEIALLMAEGFSPAEITSKRKTSINTTRWHRKQIYAKMDVSSQSEFFRKVISLLM